MLARLANMAMALTRLMMSSQNEARVNAEMSTRAYDKPLYEYIVDTCKNLEVIPAITLESYELVTINEFQFVLCCG